MFRLLSLSLPPPRAPMLQLNLSDGQSFLAVPEGQGQSSTPTVVL